MITGGPLAPTRGGEAVTRATITTAIGKSRHPAGAVCAAALAAAVVLGGCATGRAYRMGEKEMSAQNYDRAVLLFSKAVSTQPSRVEAAIAEFQQAVYLDPSHQYAANELSKALAEWQKQQRQDESEME